MICSTPDSVERQDIYSLCVGTYEVQRGKTNGKLGIRGLNEQGGKPAGEGCEAGTACHPEEA